MQNTNDMDGLVVMKLENYLEEDIKKTYEFQDEGILSNLYLSSLPVSMRELESHKGRIEKERNEVKKRVMLNEYEKDKKRQAWMSEHCSDVREIPTISLDQLKNRTDASLNSCDAYFFAPITETNRRNLMIEFKNVNKNKILEYMRDNGKDGLWQKVAGSEILLGKKVEFDGYNDGELIPNTHLMIVYGERADVVSTMHMNLGEKSTVSRNKAGRQDRAVRITKQKNKQYSKKETKEILDEFAGKMRKKGFACCSEGYFGIPIKEPDAERLGKEERYWYTLYSKQDFQRVVSDIKFFENWNWGVYGKYFEQIHEQSRQ